RDRVRAFRGEPRLRPGQDLRAATRTGRAAASGDRPADVGANRAGWPASATVRTHRRRLLQVRRATLRRARRLAPRAPRARTGGPAAADLGTRQVPDHSDASCAFPGQLLKEVRPRCASKWWAPRPNF